MFIKTTAVRLTGISLLLSSFTATGYAFKTDENPKRPNLVLINIDDMGWCDVGFMGSEYYETPNNEFSSANNLIIMEVLKNPDFWQ